MGRAPCCDKMGVKKGPWTAEEDQILIDFIHRNGHGNWRALPKQAGLSRCGKSCRLRWINYLRPDIKRGNFSYEEEESIIKLHQLMGNRWSAIASRLPGRTDNEIKNMWNTHLKKRLLRTGIEPVTSAVATDSRFPMAPYSMTSFDYSECSEASPSMQKDVPAHNSVLTQPNVSVDYPTINLSYSDDLSSEIFSSIVSNLSESDDLSSEIFSSIDSETLNPGSTIQFNCTESFDVPFGCQQYPAATEDHTKRHDLQLGERFILGNQNFGDEESSEDLYYMSSYAENDVLNSMDGANTNPHLLWNGDDDDYDSMDYWLSVLRQIGPSPIV